MAAPIENLQGSAFAGQAPRAIEQDVFVGNRGVGMVRDGYHTDTEGRWILEAPADSTRGIGHLALVPGPEEAPEQSSTQIAA